MIVDIDVQLAYGMVKPTDLIVQIEADNSHDQCVLDQKITFEGAKNITRISGEGGVGQRVLIQMQDDFACKYSARIEVKRPKTDMSSLSANQPHTLSAEAVRYLMPSRYCLSDELFNFALKRFRHLEGGKRIIQMRDWVYKKIEYAIGASNAQTTAIDTFTQRRGTCRDFAHILITLARATGIPARYASVYAPNVTPQDFHAVVEVFLENEWHLVDATMMAQADEIVRIGVGLDAAEVSFLSSYDAIHFKAQNVEVTRVI